MKVSENTSIDMPLKNLLSIVGAVAIGVWAYSGIVERINQLENKINPLITFITNLQKQITEEEETDK